MSEQRLQAVYPFFRQAWEISLLQHHETINHGRAAVFIVFIRKKNMPCKSPSW